jgi:acyl carrier protein
MEQRVINVVESCRPRDGEIISLQMEIQRDLGFESLDMMLLWNELETEFGVTIRDDDLKDIKTVGDILEKMKRTV